MAEVPVCNANAAVYVYDPAAKNWKAGDTGLSRVGVYHNPATNTYRVVALDAKSNAPTINSPIFKELPYQKASETFHQWTDPRGSYGLNFASPAEANSFANSIADCINKLKSGVSATPLPPILSPHSDESHEDDKKGKKDKKDDKKKVDDKKKKDDKKDKDDKKKKDDKRDSKVDEKKTLKVKKDDKVDDGPSSSGSTSAPPPPTPPSAPSAPSAPTPPSAPSGGAGGPPPPPPPPPPSAPSAPTPPSAPSAPSGGGAPPPPPPPGPSAASSGGGGLSLAEQIARKKEALAKAETVDKSSPTLEAPKDGPKAAPTASSGGGGGGGDFQSELLAKMKRRQNSVETPQPRAEVAPREPVAAAPSPGPTKAAPGPRTTASKFNVTANAAPTAAPTTAASGTGASASELEQLKAEIFAYIDKAKNEILEAIRANQQQQ